MAKEVVTFRETPREARGRNGYFEPAVAEVEMLGVPEARVAAIHVFGKRRANAPIMLDLQPGDARALARAITKVAGGKV